MKVKISRIPQDTSTEVEIAEGESVQMLLKRLRLHPDSVIVLRGNVPIPIDELLVDDQELRIFQVASGG